MTSWVALATDAKPEYAIYAPVVARMWLDLGYNVLLARSREPGWDSALGQLVLAELEALDQARLRVTQFLRCYPLSLGNTMRCARLALYRGLPETDLVVTSDIDMAPVHREHFNPRWLEHHAGPSGAVVLRADMYGPFTGAMPLDANGHLRPIPGLFRLPMCYVAARVALWRRIFGAQPTLEDIVRGLRHDDTGFDEQTLSARLFSLTDAPIERRGDAYVQRLPAINDGWPSYITYELNTAWPDGRPLGMLLGGEHEVYENSHRWVPVIDWHMPRPAQPWVGPQLALLVGGDVGRYIRGYWGRAILAAQEK